MNNLSTFFTERPPDHSSRAWLEHFPSSRRSGLANWFHHAVRDGHGTPAAVVQQVICTAQSRLRWAHSNDEEVRIRHVLECLQADYRGAMAYAASVIAWEALPHAERERQKPERATHYQHQHMAQLPVTDKQVSFLRTLGYAGERPTDRAAASALIDTLLHHRQEVSHA